MNKSLCQLTLCHLTSLKAPSDCSCVFDLRLTGKMNTLNTYFLGQLLSHSMLFFNQYQLTYTGADPGFSWGGSNI